MNRSFLSILLLSVCILSTQARQIVVMNQHFTHTADGGNDKHMGFCLFTPPVNLPADWIEPDNYAEGMAYFRLKVINKPGSRPGWYNFGFQQGDHPFGEHFCDRIEITTAKTYEWNQPVNTWWKPDDPKLHVDFSKSINRFMAVYWDREPSPNRQLDDRWGYGKWLTPEILKAYFPMEVHFQVVLVSKGSKFQGFPAMEDGFPKFSTHTIDNIGAQMGQTSLTDVDNDGDLDWIVGCQGSGPGGDIWWWEYQSPDKWIRHSLGKGNTDVGGSVFDLNGDGWIDMFSGSRVLINTGKPRTEEFIGYDIGAVYSHDSEFAEINGDGKIDAIANSDRTGLFWYEIPNDPTQPWAAHTIAKATEHKIHGGVSPKAVGDLDGDGDSDVVTGEAWYENLNGKGLQWKQHKNIDFGERHKYGLAVKTWVLDMDGDGDSDFVQAEADNPDSRVAWFENDGKGNWTRHIIKDKGDKQDFHSLVIADFDLDGDWDVFSGGGPLSSGGKYLSYIWENTAGQNKNPDSSQWEEHIVANKPCHEAFGADVDGDGDTDLCSKPWRTGNEHFYLQNRLIP